MGDKAMRVRLTAVFVSCASLFGIVQLTTGRPWAAAPPPALDVLSPGAFHDISHIVDVNIVFVGYEAGAGPRDVNWPAIFGALPGMSRPLHRFPDFYGIRQPLGLTYLYRYQPFFADAAFENQFFAYLTSIAVSRPRTLFQDGYNTQPPRALTVGANHWIDAPSVERWLVANPPAGVDTSRYTIFLVNWYGRADFKFHVYTKTDEPDPDTNYNFGVIRASRKIIAWGGTSADDPESGLGSTRRIWFHDLSAGPESWTANWNITSADVDGDGGLDYRMPPIWEYGNPAAGLYRPFNNLSGDLAKIIRYVAIDLLFTTSPLYKPAISPPRLPSKVQVDLNVYQGDPAVDGRQYLRPAYLRDKLAPLQPLNAISTEVNSVPFVGKAARVYHCFLVDQSCFGSRLFGIAFGDLFLYHSDRLNQFIEGDGDYEVPVFLYNTTDALFPGFLGFADDNWADGTQSFIFGFDTPFLRSIGYGLTTTSIHEVGHHLGMSHPHDGFDYENDIDFGPSGPFFYAWAGDESNTIMSYIDLNADFSQFDRDNMNRYLTAAYINQANAVLAMIYASPRAAQATALLLAADAAAGAALTAMEGMNYPGAAAAAKLAYTRVLEAAASINVQVEPQNYTADYRAKGASPKFVDTVGYQRSAP